MPRVQDQTTKRRSAIATDQHGREWGITIEVSTMAPVGTPNPTGWSPVELPGGRRLQPPQKFLEFDPVRIGTMVINYDGWINELEAASEQWEQQLANQAQGMYGDKAADAMMDPPPALLRLAGPRPFPVDLAEACRDGNPWALGVPKAKPTKALEAVLQEMQPRRRHRAAETAPKAKAQPAEATTT